MDFQELIAERYSVRKFKADPVPEELLQQLLEAARLAPTGRNLQDFHIYALRSPEALKKAADCSPCTYGAPLVLVFCCDRQAGLSIPINGVDLPQMDAAIVMTHVMLAAAALGLGSCWVAFFDEAKTRAALDIPDNLQPVGFLPVGYAAVGPGENHGLRREVSDLCEIV